MTCTTAAFITVIILITLLGLWANPMGTLIVLAVALTFFVSMCGLSLIFWWIGLPLK